MLAGVGKTWRGRLWWSGGGSTCINERPGVFRACQGRDVFDLSSSHIFAFCSVGYARPIQAHLSLHAPPPPAFSCSSASWLSISSSEQAIVTLSHSISSTSKRDERFAWPRSYHGTASPAKRWEPGRIAESKSVLGFFLALLIFMADAAPYWLPRNHSTNEL